MIASDAYASVTSAVVRLTVVPLVITQQPTNQAIWPGGTVAFKVAASGGSPIHYQWQCSGTNIPSATTNVLLLTNCQPSQYGLPYDVVVTNAYTNLISRAVTISTSQIAVWGNGAYGQTNVPPGLTNVIAISAEVGSVALKADGTAIVWPSDLPPGQVNAATNLIAVTGPNPLLGLKTNGVVTTFPGDGLVIPLGFSNVVALAPDFSGYLFLMSNGTVVGTSIPPGMTNVVALAQGNGHSLVLKANGTVSAWGNNSYGQATVPPGLSNIVAIGAGWSHSLALRSNGTIAAWGYNANGQTNVPAGLSNVVAVAGGQTFSLALRADGTVAAWGGSIYGETNIPPGVTNVLAIAAGQYHALALMGSGPLVQTDSMKNPALRSNRFSASVPSQSGRVFALEYKTNLADNGWTALPLAAGTGTNLILIDPSATNTQRVYRVRRW